MSSAEGSGLTSAEARIAHLCCGGLSIKIAADLSLAPKTVEMNLSNVYRKLGIRPRPVERLAQAVNRRRVAVM